jgi:hypothetical protein
MSKLKFYVLCSKGVAALKRHLRTIPKTELFVVINTLDTDFEKAASYFCESEGIEYAVTESNGTCAQGKNSLLDLFVDSENDYAVCIDGDDYVTEYGYQVYSCLVKGEKIPDVVALINQKGIKRSLVTYFESPENDNSETDPETIKGTSYYPFKRDRSWWGNILAMPDDSSMKKWAVQCRRYIMPEETHLRFTFLSKKAASMFRYDDRFKIGEDTLMYLNYKKAWAQGLIDLVHFDEEPNPTYIYDSRVAGVVATEKGKHEDSRHPMQWVKILVEEYNRYEDNGWMVEATVPVINK